MDATVVFPRCVPIHLNIRTRARALYDPHTDVLYHYCAKIDSFRGAVYPKHGSVSHMVRSRGLLTDLNRVVWKSQSHLFRDSKTVSMKEKQALADAVRAALARSMDDDGRTSVNSFFALTSDMGLHLHALLAIPQFLGVFLEKVMYYTYHHITLTEYPHVNARSIGKRVFGMNFLCLRIPGHYTMLDGGKPTAVRTYHSLTSEAEEKPLPEPVDSHTECCVCYESHNSCASKDKWVTTHCGHTFCYSCITHWVMEQGKNTCPMCRADTAPTAVMGELGE